MSRCKVHHSMYIKQAPVVCMKMYMHMWVSAEDMPWGNSRENCGCLGIEFERFQGP